MAKKKRQSKKQRPEHVVGSLTGMSASEAFSRAQRLRWDRIQISMGLPPGPMNPFAAGSKQWKDWEQLPRHKGGKY